MVVLLSFVAWVALSIRIVAFPDADPPGHSQVLHLVGGEPYGIAEALRMMDEGEADTLVLSAYGHPAICEEGYRGHRVICFDPVPFTTQGEAMEFGRLAQQEGWTSVSVATWPSHILRTRLLYERCFSGEIRMRATSYPYTARDYVKQAVHETGGLAKAIIAPGCDQLLPYGLSN